MEFLGPPTLRRKLSLETGNGFSVLTYDKLLTGGQDNDKVNEEGDQKIFAPFYQAMEEQCDTGDTTCKFGKASSANKACLTPSSSPYDDKNTTEGSKQEQTFQGCDGSHQPQFLPSFRPVKTFGILYEKFWCLNKERVSRFYLFVFIVVLTLLLLGALSLFGALFRPCDMLELLGLISSNGKLQNIDSYINVNDGLQQSSFTPWEPLRSNTTYNVVLYGDSLIHRPYHQHNLPGKIAGNLPDYNLRFYDAGVEGQTISEIRSRLDSDVLEHSPDAVILFWDSDCSNIDENQMTDSEVKLLREAYIVNLNHVIYRIVASGAFLAVAGPGVLGESYGFLKPARTRYFHRKWPMLEAYRDINRRIAKQNNVTYIDVRQAFLRVIPSYEKSFSQCVTSDGEHENERGTKIIAGLFAEALRQGLR